MNYVPWDDLSADFIRLAMARGGLRWYIKVFLLAYGPPPWNCNFCGNPVDALKHFAGVAVGAAGGHVHHLNHNSEDNHPQNLVVSHQSCHQSYHARHSGNEHLHTAEVRKKISQANLGKPHIEKRYHCGGCGLITTRGPLKHHQRASGHEGSATA